MKYEIKNEKLSCSILHSGAEICSLKSIISGKEYMWSANPDVWGSYAPVLFPIVAGLKDGKYTFNGEEYSLPKHGFIRKNSDLVLVEHTENKVKLAVEFNGGTLKLYPFKFRFTITFELVESVLNVQHTVENLDTKAIYFSTGGHPGFACPVNEGENYSDYYLEFDQEENVSSYQMDANGFISDNTVPLLKDSSILQLSDSIFNDDALILKDLKSKQVALKSKTSDQTLVMRFDDFQYFGIWAKPKSPFVCLEPWNGLPDNVDASGDITEKEGISVLQVGGIYTDHFSIEIQE